MVQTRIKPYLEQVAEQARRVEQTRVYRRNQILGLLIVAAVILAWALIHTNPKWISRPAGGAHDHCMEQPLGRGQAASSGSAPRPHRQRQDGALPRAGRAVQWRNRQLRLVAVYRGMDLGTAKPTAAERAHLPHHLIDVADPDQPFTAGEYSRQARAALKAIAQKGRLPIVTGGTGLYLRALTEGLFPGPARQADLRERLERSRQRHGDPWLHRLLTRLDPPPPRASMPTTCPSCCAPLKSASPRASRSRSFSATKKLPVTAHRLPPAAHRPQPAAQGPSAPRGFI